MKTLSSWTVGKAVKQKLPAKRGCAYCGKLGHNRRTCTSVPETLARLKDRLASIQADRHPFEWERQQVVNEALTFIASRRPQRGQSKTSMAKDLYALTRAAHYAMAAWHWGKK